MLLPLVADLPLDEGMLDALRAQAQLERKKFDRDQLPPAHGHRGHRGRDGFQGVQALSAVRGRRVSPARSRIRMEKAGDESRLYRLHSRASPHECPADTRTGSAR